MSKSKLYSARVVLLPCLPAPSMPAVHAVFFSVDNPVAEVDTVQPVSFGGHNFHVILKRAPKNNFCVLLYFVT